jgi:hypothetical protein
VEREKSEAGRGRTSLTKLFEFRRRKAKRDRTGKQEIEDKEQNRKERITGKESKEHNRNRVYTKQTYPKKEGPVGAWRRAGHVVFYPSESASLREYGLRFLLHLFQ